MSAVLCQQTIRCQHPTMRTPVSPSTIAIYPATNLGQDVFKVHQGDVHLVADGPDHARVIVGVVHQRLQLRELEPVLVLQAPASAQPAPCLTLQGRPYTWGHA